MGIIGLGRIGRAVAKIAQAFGMKVIAAGRVGAPPPAPSGDDVGKRGRGRRADPTDLERTDLETLLRTSDVVSLHCPLTSETKHLINAKRLAIMKQSAFLLNTSRGPLIDESALADALRRGQIAGAGLDVLTEEPPPAEHPLYTAPNCFITPHIAWATRAARARLMRVGVENVRAFIQGKPQNVVS
ncbi:MAG TPA: NAD(P)-dependent oxidoreductase, partial [Candidatus Binatia bacterium]|nr:NAD(P)-dependent oxidoreductase [Candidatus Binatia bacterium]